MKKYGLNAIKTLPLLIAKFPHLFQPGGGFPHLDQILDLTLQSSVESRLPCYVVPSHCTQTGVSIKTVRLVSLVCVGLEGAIVETYPN